MSVAVARPALAIHPGALGDVLLAIPALRALRAERGGVTLAAQRHIAELLVSLGEADAARTFESLRLHAVFAGAGAAELPDADRVVCWVGARDPDFVRRLRAQAPSAVVAPSVGSGLVWEHLLQTVAPPAGAWRGTARVEPELVAAGRRALVDAGWDARRRVVVVQPGAGAVAKCWPAEGFAAALSGLVARSDVTIVLHQGPADAEAVEMLHARLPGALRLREPSLPALAGALRHAAAYLGNDCGVSHLAAAVGTPAVVLFAAANLPWRPWAQDPVVLTVETSRAETGEAAAVREAIERRLG